MTAKPKRFNDYETYSVSLLETQFMALNAAQRQSVVRGLRLYLNSCENKCSNHELFQYLIENFSKLNHFYEALPLACNRYKRNKGLKVKFSNVISFSDGNVDTMKSFHICLNDTKSLYLLDSTGHHWKTQ